MSWEKRPVEPKMHFRGAATRASGRWSACCSRSPCLAGGDHAFDLAREAVEAAGDGDAELAVRQTRAVSFLYLLPSLGLPLIFGSEPARTAIHVGSYLIPILALCGAAVGLRATFPRFAIWYLAANAVLMLALYVPSIEPLLPDTGFSPLAALFAAASLAAFAVLALRGEAADRPLPSTPADKIAAAR
jgi:hypothetical protein